jgi:hypothetical protein
LLVAPEGGAALQGRLHRSADPTPLKTRLFQSFSDTFTHRFHIDGYLSGETTVHGGFVHVSGDPAVTAAWGMALRIPVAG